jgi:hypothetical protein
MLSGFDDDSAKITLGLENSEKPKNKAKTPIIDQQQYTYRYTKMCSRF